MDSLLLPGVGMVERDSSGFLVTPPRAVALAPREVSFMLEEDVGPSDAGAIAACIDTFCTLDASALTVAADALFAYYDDQRSALAEYDWFPADLTPETVWDHVDFGDMAVLARDRDADARRWYVVWENECEWEPEHGLQLVFRDGAAITRISDYDGHPTWQSAMGDGYAIPADAIYWSPRD